MNRLKPYPKYKGSGIEWLGRVPGHWEVCRQDACVRFLVSNVDKNSVEGEIPVRLCNYIDVYRNRRITDKIPFMHATARPEEISSFRVRSGDIPITKDSESWTDIGVPSLVACESDDLVYGYHLAILRPRKDMITSSFLLRASESQAVMCQYHVAAKGVTRYGLSRNSIKSIRVPIPPLVEQQAIAHFLDWVDRRINRYIRSRQKLMALLNEEKQAIINQAVTRGLDPSVRLKPSGMEWLGDVPDNWEMIPAKRLYREANERSDTGNEDLLSVSHLTGVTPRTQKKVTMFMASSYVGHKICRPGDLVINTMWAWMGALGVSKQAGLVSPSYGVYRPVPDSALLSDYADVLLRASPM